MPIHAGGNKRVALKNVIGIDHAVVVVTDLDKAAGNWKRLGFTVSPRGTHSARMGSGNYTIMLDPDYIELLGVLVETEHNTPTRAFLAQRGEGIERIAFTAVDSAAGAEEIRVRGYQPVGPTDFERPVTMPDGSLSAAKFRIFQWPIEEAPAGLRIFACQHKTRETVWIPELMKHANGAKRIKQVLVVSPEPAKDAAHLARMIDREVRGEPDGAVAVPSGSDRADFIFLTKEQLGRRYPAVSLTGLPERGGAGLVLATGDLAATEKAVGNAGVRSGSALCIAPAAANGSLLAFVTG
jgi:Glyoxalase-like domain